MRAQRRREAHWVEPGALTPANGKRLLRSSEGRRRTKFLLRVLGVALFVACPYLYLLVMQLASGRMLEPFVLVLFPALMEAVAVFIHRKGV